MQVTVENGEGLARQMIVELSPDDIEREIDKTPSGFRFQRASPGVSPRKGADANSATAVWRTV